jgi:hypothetical protein
MSMAILIAGSKTIQLSPQIFQQGSRQTLSAITDIP